MTRHPMPPRVVWVNFDDNLDPYNMMAVFPTREDADLHVRARRATIERTYRYVLSDPLARRAKRSKRRAR